MQTTLPQKIRDVAYPVQNENLFRLILFVLQQNSLIKFASEQILGGFATVAM